MIEYREDPGVISAEKLVGGFFEGWPFPPSPELHLAHLRSAEVAVLAVNAETEHGRRIRDAIGGGALTCFTPLLEVLPEYRGRGIGQELVRRLLARIGDRYSIDLVCDPGLVPFYECLGGVPGTAMMWPNRDAVAR